MTYSETRSRYCTLGVSFQIVDLEKSDAEQLTEYMTTHINGKTVYFSNLKEAVEFLLRFDSLISRALNTKTAIELIYNDDADCMYSARVKIVEDSKLPEEEDQQTSLEKDGDSLLWKTSMKKEL